MTATAFQTDSRVYKLVAFQDVNEALDETEAKAWQKLLSVMTHEIMNSVAPISSLAETMLHRLQESSRILEGQPGALGGSGAGYRDDQAAERGAVEVCGDVPESE
jgi:two-component system nitrogen regulation sensor histidine kinase NtrY